MSLVAPPKPFDLRPSEFVAWSGTPCWRTLARRAFHIQAVGLYLCVLIFANAIAARMQDLPPAVAFAGEKPILILGAVMLAAIALLAWATARTTRYTVTNQRVVMQYGIAITATLALPMRLVGAVSVSDRAIGDIVIRLKPGQKIAFGKLWPHVRPWRAAHPEPMLLALPAAAAAASLISRTVMAAQAVERAPAMVEMPYLMAAE